MAFKEEKKIAEDAFSEFFNRVKDFLWGCCINTCKEFRKGYELASELFQETMCTAYENVEKFTFPQNINTSEQELRIKKWLSVIAKNKLREMIRNDKNYTNLDTDYFHYFFNKIDEELKTCNDDNSDELNLSSQDKKRKVLDDALSTLKEKEKDVLLTYFLFYQPDKYLPESEIQVLCNRYKTTPENLRQIKRRARIKVEEYIKNNYK
jgi:RNA polymerase sigma factor (sigma-70 family)